MEFRERKISDITGYKFNIDGIRNRIMSDTDNGMFYIEEDTDRRRNSIQIERPSRNSIQSDLEFGKLRISPYTSDRKYSDTSDLFIEDTRRRRNSVQIERPSRNRIQSDPEFSKLRISPYNSDRKYSDTSDLRRTKFNMMFRKKNESDMDVTKESALSTNNKMRRRSCADVAAFFTSNWRNPRKSNERIFPCQMIPENNVKYDRFSNASTKVISKTRSAQNLGSLLPRKSKAQLFSKTSKAGVFLRRVQSEKLIQPVWKNRKLPLLRFRKAVRMVQLLLRVTLSTRPTQRNDVKFLSWAHYQDEILSSKRSYEMVGLSFDPSNYRAKKEISLSNEAKLILSMAPGDRTKDQLKIALLALNQTVEAFSEFPITMQKSLVRVGWYERFEDKRVIIRQGHMADNFYFILSGTAIVTKLETDLQTGEEVTRTVAVLKKGNSFGELALMHGARRSATVICKEEVELLAVGREDFVDVFMPIDSKQEPEHIRFLRSVDVFTGWPIEKLPYHDPKICCFTYFRRGLLLCKDSNSSEWLYIIKTGSCRVLKALYCTKPNIKGLKSKSSEKGSCVCLPPLHSPTSTTSSSLSSDMSLLNQSIQREESKRRRHGYTLGYLHNIMSKPPEEIALTLLEHRQTIDDVYKSKTVSRSYKAARKKREREEQALEAKKDKIPKVYVQIQKLGPRDSYGIEQVAFGMIDKTTSVILVSDGAECILINKKFFKQHLTDRAAKDIRRTYQPLPTEESLQQKLQDKTNWEAYKSMTVVKYISNKQSVQESLFL